MHTAMSSSKRDSLDHTHSEAECRGGLIYSCITELLEPLQPGELLAYRELVQHVTTNHPTFDRGEVMESLNASIVWSSGPPMIEALKTSHGLMCRVGPASDDYEGGYQPTAEDLDAEAQRCTYSFVENVSKELIH